MQWVCICPEYLLSLTLASFRNSLLFLAYLTLLYLFCFPLIVKKKASFMTVSKCLFPRPLRCVGYKAVFLYLHRLDEWCKYYINHIHFPEHFLILILCSVDLRAQVNIIYVHFLIQYYLLAGRAYVHNEYDEKQVGERGCQSCWDQATTTGSFVQGGGN